MVSTLGDHDTGDDDGGDGRDVEENQTRETITAEDALVGDTDMDLFGILQAACSDHPPKKRKSKQQKTKGQTEQSTMLDPEDCNGDDLFQDSSVFTFLGAEELQAFRQVRNLCQSCPSSKLSEWAPELSGNVCSEDIQDNNEGAHDGGESTDGSDDWEATILENASDQPFVSSSSSSASGSKPSSGQTGIGEHGKQDHVACPFFRTLCSTNISFGGMKLA